MLQATRYILIVFGLVAMWASTSRDAMQYIFEKRDVKNKWWGADQLDHGDLASMAYLNFVQQFSVSHEAPVFKRPMYNGSNNTALYLHGDSYTRHIPDSVFAGVASYAYIDRNHKGYYHLDPKRRNVLVLEISERYLRTYFGDLQIFNFLYDSSSGTNPAASANVVLRSSVRMASLAGHIPMDRFFNKYINQNLQFNLFNYQFMMPLFGSKAAINYYLFHRASGDVVISRKKDFLFLKETVSLTDVGSSYVHINKEEIIRLINNFNAIYDYYKNEGFDEVYLSVIPNAATICQPEGYNNLIPQLQHDPALRMKVIDAYYTFKNSQEVLYLTGDTHWNNKGRQLWLDLLNEKLLNHE